MPTFASREWVAELDACLGRVASPPADASPLVVNYVVTDVPGRVPSSACYRIELDAGQLRACYGSGCEDDRPSVTFTQPYAVAAAIAAGELAAQTAILDGRLRVHGSVAALPAWRRWLQPLDAALDELRATTTY